MINIFFQELIGNYIFMEEYFMRETVMKVSCAMFDVIRVFPSNAWTRSSLASYDYFTIRYHWILYSASGWSPAQLFFAYFKGYFHMFLLFVVSNKICVHRKQTRECDRYIHGSRNFFWFYHFYYISSYLRYFLHNVSTSSP